MANSSQLWATVAAASVASGLIGYFVGIGSGLPISRGGTASTDTPDDSDSDSVVGDEDDLKALKAHGDEPCKLVLVVRTDLNMTKGKIAAQCGQVVKHWERTGQAKIAVKCDSEDDLLVLQATAKSLGVCARSIQDAGRTQVAAGSTTVLGVGPAPVRVINQITGHLKLL
ncbi:hypothetical protein OIO90_002769 [Microbotryomycetes sp. JL221]|nr:hypothetical protein OIO90_002769 [Microbotryomycetes sp. JL221]